MRSQNNLKNLATVSQSISDRYFSNRGIRSLNRHNFMKKLHVYNLFIFVTENGGRKSDATIYFIMVVGTWRPNVRLHLADAIISPLKKKGGLSPKIEPQPPNSPMVTGLHHVTAVPLCRCHALLPPCD